MFKYYSEEILLQRDKVYSVAYPNFGKDCIPYRLLHSTAPPVRNTFLLFCPHTLDLIYICVNW
jgi:hypothetical protein